MENYSLYSYLSSSVGYSILLILAILRYKNNLVNICFAIAVGGSFISTLFTAFCLQNPSFFTYETLAFETLSYALWFNFLIVLLIDHQYNSNYALLIKSWPVYLLFTVILLLLFLETFNGFYTFSLNYIPFDIRFFVHNSLAIFGLLLIEYIYRNSNSIQQWSIKFICLGLGFLFFYDFTLFSKSLLYAELDLKLWESRGFVHLLLLPLLTISFNRLQQKTTVKENSISRQVVFPTAILFGTGIYLILMSLAGQYISQSGNGLGQTILPIFVSLSLLLFLVLAFSHQIRAKAKVLFSKHFFQFNYDYREHWLKLNESLSQLNNLNELSSFFIKTIAGLVDCSGGGLWLKNEQGNYYLAKDENLGFHALPMINSDDSVVQFLVDTKWIIDFSEYKKNPEAYTELDLSQWMAKTNNVWLIIPLFRQDEMLAFIVISNPLITRKLNWEDRDIIKTVAMQLSNSLALSHTSHELSLSRQFEAYNQLSAYLVHDLKNLVTQVSLIVKNAETYKHNPEFIDDSIETLKNVSDKLQHLVAQLKKDTSISEDQGIVNLIKIINDVAIQQAGNKPPLTITTPDRACLVNGEKTKMIAILGHLVQNAQEATAAEGWVKLQLKKTNHHAIIKIMDNGIGMDSVFISERLFKPFDTTKGNAGMGIGVYEAQDYILKQSGQIYVKSSPGRGTTFTITLPLAFN